MATATFGRTANGSSSTAISVDRKTVSQAIPTSCGQVISLTARVWSAATTPAKAVIYADSGGNPGALLAVSDEVSLTNTTEAAITFNFSGANLINIVGGTPYWIGVIVQDPGAGNWTISRANTAALQKVSADTYSDGPSDPFGSPTDANGKIDAYVTYTVAKWETIVDNFNDNSLDPLYVPWTPGDYVETSQTLRITSTTAASYPGGDRENTQQDLTGSFVALEIVHALTGLTDAGTFFQLYLDASNTLTFFIYNGTLTAEKQIATSFTTIATVAYNSTTHRWLRIREASGTIYFDYSADGVTWTNFTTCANPFAITGLTLSIFIGTDAANGGTDTAIFDNLNNLPTSFIKTKNGLAKASIKTINGLAIASVKSINALT